MFQNFKTQFISKYFTNEMIKWTKTAKQFLFCFQNFHFEMQPTEVFCQKRCSKEISKDSHETTCVRVQIY